MADKKGFDVLDFYSVDEDLAKDGAKMFLPEDPEGKAYFLIRPYPNEDQQRMTARLYTANSSVFDKMKNGTEEEKAAAEALDRDLTAQVNATHVLVGCGGMSEKYSVDFGVKCLRNIRLRERILSFAVNLNNFKAKEKDIQEK